MQNHVSSSRHGAAVVSIVFLFIAELSAQYEVEAFLCRIEALSVGEEELRISSSGSPFVLGPSGVIAANVTFATEFGQPQDRGLVIKAPGEAPQLVLRTGDTIAPGETFQSSPRIQVSSDGQVAAVAGLAAFRAAVLVGTGSAGMNTLAYDGQAGGPEGRTFFGVERIAMSANGQFAYSGGWGPSSFFRGIWDGPPGAANALVEIRKVYPGLPDNSVVTDISNYHAINSSGQILFAGAIGQMEAINGFPAVLLRRGGSISPVAISTARAPGFGEENTYSEFDDLGISDSGTAWFQGGVRRIGNVLFASQGGEVEPVIVSSSPVPGIEGATFTVNRITPKAMSDSGMLLIETPAHYGPDAVPRNENTIWTWDSGTLKLIARDGMAIPGHDGKVFRKPSGSALSRHGQIALTDEQGIWLQTGTGGFEFVAERLGDITVRNNDGTTETRRGVRTAPPAKGIGIDDFGRILVNVPCVGLLSKVQDDRTGGLRGHVFEDADLDGAFSDGDRSLSKVPIDLYRITEGEPEQFPVGGAITRQGGFFEIGDMPVGDYELRLSPHIDYDPIANQDGSNRMGTQRITILEGAFAGNFDFLVSREPPPPVEIKMYGLSDRHHFSPETRPASMSGQPLVPNPDTFELGLIRKGGSITTGLIADGVTPLLFSLQFDDPKQIGQEYQLEFEVTTPNGIAAWHQPRIRTRSNSGRSWDSGARKIVPTEVPFTAYAYLEPIPCAALNTTNADKEVAARVLVRQAEEDATSQLNFRLRKPMVVLFASDSWGNGLTEALKSTRPDNFVVPIIVGDKASEALARESQRNAGSWPGLRDLVVHGSTKGALAGLITQKYWNERPRGAFRRGVCLGVPFYDGPTDLGLFYTTMRNRLLLDPVGLAVMPRYLRRFNALASLANGAGFAGFSELEASPFPQLHLAATGVPFDSPAFRMFGLTTNQVQSILPLGSDGIVRRENALADAEGRGNLGNSAFILPEPPVAHVVPGIFGADSSQTEAAEVGQHIARVLDSRDDEGFFKSFGEITANLWSTSQKQRRATERQEVIDLANSLSFSFSEIDEIAANEDGDGEETVRHFLFNVMPNAPIDGKVTWIADAYSHDGAKSGALPVETSGQFDQQASLRIPADFCGDLVLFGSYISTDGELVFASPEVVASIDLPDGTIEEIELSGISSALPVNGQFPIELVQVYADGTRLTRLATPEEFGVTSSDPAIIDVSDPTNWRTGSEGVAEVDVTYRGETETLTFDVGTRRSDLSPTVAELKGVDYPAVWLSSGTSSEEASLVIESSTDLEAWTELIDVADLSQGFGNLATFFSDLVVEVEDDSILIRDRLPLGDGAASYYRLRSSEDADLGEVTGTTLLTFDGDGWGNRTSIPQDYGDRVSAAVMGSYSYGGGAGFTPNVTVGLGPDGAVPRLWTTQYGDLTNILYEDNDNFGQLEVTLTADEGFLVSLHQWKMAAYGPVFSSDPTINEVSVRDGQGTLLYQETDFPISETAHTLFDFTAEPLEASQLILRFDSGNLGNLSDDIAFDDIEFGQRPAP